ncbi:hypothetical protein [Desulfonema magnum]|uniref:Uncharacterized protein n=1 Tax=Desulfonema magnum TaxID=45655 RepID=A0A975GPV5_9BACT|nr:hypothetical protein [Desulfonema magnum]QTA89219.1 Uncharacterized protein dnm_052690 [Desulfonema magnum]
MRKDNAMKFLLSPRLDIVFKKLFTQDTEILTDLAKYRTKISFWILGDASVRINYKLIRTTLF